MAPFQLRSASDSDLELTYEITKEAMGEYVVQTWGKWDDGELQRSTLPAESWFSSTTRHPACLEGLAGDIPVTKQEIENGCY